MGSGRGSWVNALRPLRRARVYPDLLGLLQRVRAFFLRVSFVRGGISVAAGRTSGRDFGTRAQHCVGARHLLCSSQSFELEMPITGRLGMVAGCRMQRRSRLPRAPSSTSEERPVISAPSAV